MPTPGQRVEMAYSLMRGIPGCMATVITLRRGLTRSEIERWAKGLRSAAEELERILKEM